jgi:hypothetical protein
VRGSSRLPSHNSQLSPRRPAIASSGPASTTGPVLIRRRGPVSVGRVGASRSPTPPVHNGGRGAGLQAAAGAAGGVSRIVRFKATRPGTTSAEFNRGGRR